MKDQTLFCDLSYTVTPPADFSKEICSGTVCFSKMSDFDSFSDQTDSSSVFFFLYYGFKNYNIPFYTILVPKLEFKRIELIKTYTAVINVAANCL
jgi:hypothetical protein